MDERKENASIVARVTIGTGQGNTTSEVPAGSPSQWQMRLRARGYRVGSSNGRVAEDAAREWDIGQQRHREIIEGTTSYSHELDLRCKLKEDGDVTRCKTHLMAQGFPQMQKKILWD